jgi:sugar lactone lactonase YvrE
MINTHVLIAVLASAAACASPGTKEGMSDAGTSDAGPPVADAVPFTTGVSTLAGGAQAGNADGDRSVARFSNPVNVLVAPDGTLYVSDFDNGTIRTVDPVGNVRTRVRQTGFARPFGLALAGNTLYVQTDNDPQGLHSVTSGTIWRVNLGSPTAPATVVATHLGRPRGLAVLADGRIAMADYQHDVIQLLDPNKGTIVVLAGRFDAPGYVDASGGAARFAQPYGLGVLGGKLVVADQGNQRVRLVDLATGATTTLAGSGTRGFADGTLATAQLAQPQGLAIDAAGDIYVTDTMNYRVRRIHDGVVDTVAGNGTAGYLDADDRLAAELYGLEGIAVSHDGTSLFLADGSRGDAVPYNRVRSVNMAP